MKYGVLNRISRHGKVIENLLPVREDRYARRAEIARELDALKAKLRRMRAHDADADAMAIVQRAIDVRLEERARIAEEIPALTAQLMRARAQYRRAKAHLEVSDNPAAPAPVTPEQPQVEPPPSPLGDEVAKFLEEQ